MKNIYKFIIVWIAAAIVIGLLLYAIMYQVAYHDQHMSIENVRQELIYGSALFGIAIGFFVAVGPAPEIKRQRP